VLELHGDADPTVLYAGGLDGTIAYPGAVETVSDWADKNGCGATLDESGAPRDLDSSLPGAETKVGTFAGCPPGGDVELWTIQGGGHTPNFGADFPSVIWSYFESHAKP
jgi:polyhydroxybutyrate depolymerase